MVSTAPAIPDRLKGSDFDLPAGNPKRFRRSPWFSGKQAFNTMCED